MNAQARNGVDQARKRDETCRHEKGTTEKEHKAKKENFIYLLV
jgi:hypothetical protein